jgi:transcriptional regulator with XRE-family HTH domain
MSKFLNEVDRTVSEKIKYYRIQKGWSRKKLSEHVGVSHQQFMKYENGTNRVSAGRLGLIAAIIEVPIESFF